MTKAEILERAIRESQADLELQVSALKSRVEARVERPLRVIRVIERSIAFVAGHPIVACLGALALGALLASRRATLRASTR